MLRSSSSWNRCRAIESTLDGTVVNQGIAVYGNKGSTDQHAYVQQLRDGLPNFVAACRSRLRSQRERALRSFGETAFAERRLPAGLPRGTRAALYENGRDSITLSIPEADALHVGALIALYERAVGFYGSLVHVNAILTNPAWKPAKSRQPHSGTTTCDSRNGRPLPVRRPRRSRKGSTHGDPARMLITSCDTWRQTIHRDQGQRRWRAPADEEFSLIQVALGAPALQILARLKRLRLSLMSQPNIEGWQWTEFTGTIESRPAQSPLNALWNF